MPYNEGTSGGSLFCLRRVGLPSSLPTIGDVFSLNNGTTVVGRNLAKSDIFLDSAIHKALISRLHARITTSPNNNVVICDTSLNGTFINDQKILDTQEIKLGDTVTFGHLKGAVLEAGVVARQHNSEFKFKLEKRYPLNNYSSNVASTEEDTHNSTYGFIPDLSPFLNGDKADSCDSGTKPKITGEMDAHKTRAIHIEDLGDSECDNDELLAFATAAEDCMDEGLSDSELFSVDIDSLPTTVNSCSSHADSSPSVASVDKQLHVGKSPFKTSFYLREENNNRKESPLVINTYNTPGSQGNSLKRPKKTTKKKTKYLKSQPNDIPDTCSFRKCLRPHDREDVVEWVQCDYCYKWYHLECTGLSLDKVNNKEIKFNCGCSYSM